MFLSIKVLKMMSLIDIVIFICYQSPQSIVNGMVIERSLTPDVNFKQDPQERFWIKRDWKGNYHTIPVSELEMIPLNTPDMILPQHANPKQVRFDKRSPMPTHFIMPTLHKAQEVMRNDDDEESKLKLQESKITQSFESPYFSNKARMRIGKDQPRLITFGDPMILKKRVSIDDSHLEKRFFLAQQLAVLHGTMTPEQAKESVEKSIHLNKEAVEAAKSQN